MVNPNGHTPFILPAAEILSQQKHKFFTLSFYNETITFKGQ